MSDTVCVVYDDRCPQSVVAARYCHWFVRFVLQRETDLFDTGRQRVPSLFAGDQPRYAAALILSILDGEDRLTAADWANLQAANRITPLFTFYRAAAVIARNPAAAQLFGAVSAGDAELLTVAPAKLTYTDPVIAQAARAMTRDGQAEPLLSLPPPARPAGEFEVLTRWGERIVAFRHELNVFDGQLRVVVPRTDFPLDQGRTSVFLRQLAQLARRFRPSCAPPQRTVWPVCVRIDDPPAHWWVLRQPERMLQADDYRELASTLDRLDAKLTIMCVPATPQGRGYVPWWEVSQEYRAALDCLRQGMAKGRMEIACHGLTHLTIGRRVPSRLRERFNRLLNPLHNPTREFYDDLRRCAIPVAEQRRAIRTSMDLLEGFFGRRPRAFTPGAHNWDDTTERAAAEEGINFFACDTTWTKFPPGGPLCKNPAPLGAVPQTDSRLVYLSRLLAWPPSVEDVEALHELGVPLTISAHTYGSTSLRPDQLEAFLSMLKQFADHRHFTVSELGDLLLSEHRTVAGTDIHSASGE